MELELNKQAADATNASQSVNEKDCPEYVWKKGEECSADFSYRLSELLHEVAEEIQHKQDNSRPQTQGLFSGIQDLDRITNGWQNGTLNIIAARPGMGKSAFALSMARNMAVDYKMPLAYFSMETPARRLLLRLISVESGLKYDKLLGGQLDANDWKRLNRSISVLEKTGLTIDDSPELSVAELRAKCLSLKQKFGIRAVIIDHLQHIRSGKNVEEDSGLGINEVSHSLKVISRELDIPFIVLSPLNISTDRRTVAKRPQLQDLPGRNALERDADTIMFIHRPEYYRLETFDDNTPAAGMAELIIAKNRLGTTADVKLRFISEYAIFCNA